jgi:DNA/RNA endonuclease YhcR with UshA esterase domain
MNICKLFLSLLFLIFGLSLCAQIVITEISYNPPESNTDSLEYIELYNSSGQSLNLNGYSFEAGITHTFGDVNIDAGAYLVVAVNSGAMMNVFGVNSIQWESGGLRNSGERIAIQDDIGNIVDEVPYDDGGDWSQDPDGNGPSLELCDPTKDNALAENWLPSITSTGVMIEGAEVKGSPGAANGVMCPDNPDIIDIVITEIMYNDPSFPDSLEFIELYNNGNVDVNLENWDFNGAVDYTFPALTIDEGDYLVICSNAQAFDFYYGLQVAEWDSGDLGDNGETIQLRNANGDVMDEVTFAPDAGWPAEANSGGASLILCHPSLDNMLVNNWQAANTYSGFTLQGTEIYSNPSGASYCYFPISDLRTMDGDQSATKLDWTLTTEGIVYGVNVRNSGLQLTIIDNTNDGIALINTTNDFGYSVNEGDALTIRGTLDQFSGLIQVQLDTAWMTSADNALFDPTIVTDLSEITESQLIKIEGVSVKTASEWINSGSGFNATVTDGTNDYAVRIDADIDIFGMKYPTGTFDVIGIGGQFDGTSPYNSGYQILPRYVEDIDPYIPFEQNFPFYDIGILTTVDSEGKYDSVEVATEVRGIVYGINYRPDGLHFTLIDDNNDGIRIFSFDDNLGYTVAEGDELSVKGETDQFRGVIEIIPESIEILSTGNSLRSPDITSVLDESTESQFVQLENVDYVDVSEWLGDGSDFDVQVTDGTNMFSLRIDADSELSSMTAPSSPFNVSGLGSQHDLSSPFTEDYELYPRYISDFETILSVYDDEIDFQIDVSPNPTIRLLKIKSEKYFASISLTNVFGQKVFMEDHLNTGEHLIDLEMMPNGMYILTIQGDQWRYAESIIVIK